MSVRTVIIFAVRPVKNFFVFILLILLEVYKYYCIVKIVVAPVVVHESQPDSERFCSGCKFFSAAHQKKEIIFMPIEYVVSAFAKSFVYVCGITFEVTCFWQSDVKK